MSDLGRKMVQFPRRMQSTNAVLFSGSCDAAAMTQLLKDEQLEVARKVDGSEKAGMMVTAKGFSR